ncbi:aminotransferase [Streptacidiphilus jiangxiensis]|uniref:4-aminobutyrate aminotransferase n=1 Tax=Streptacidiphilus jiangxiensis TaxID=235985 RepID=A0A1H7HIM6_STRJI|nr:aminotransferase [Streptacidiphilus jiangxiensis]SEK50134.1 4-aminobutyrate aminotransferase [Streptacidiphilus jiangxiensis]
MNVDFFAHEALPAPQISDEEARRIAAELGVPGRVEGLGSQQDANFLVRGEGDGVEDGAILAVLKIANPAFSLAEVEAQDLAADAIATARPELRVATVLRRPDGTRRAAVVETGSGPVVARLLRHLSGGTLTGSRHLPPRAVAAMGRIAGSVSATLADFAHPGLDRVLQWDLQHADRVIALLLPHVTDPAQRAAVATAATDAWRALEALRAELPRQAVHMDLTDDNLVSTGGPVPLPDGVIDFGDVATSWAVTELAIPLSSLLHHDGVEPHAVLPAVAAFHAERPLSAAEARALWPLVVLRAATLVASGRQQAAIDGESNAYVRAALDREWRILEQAVSVPTEVMTGLFLHRLGLADEQPTLVPGVPLLADLKPTESALLDLATDSDAMDHGAWLEPGLEERLARTLLADGAAVTVAPYGQARLSRSRVLSSDSQATVPTGAELRLGRAAELQAPVDAGVLVAEPGRLDLDLGALTLRLAGVDVRTNLAPGAQVRAGERLSVLPAGARLFVALHRAGVPEVPPLVRPEYASGWLALTADPAPLLGLPTRQAEDDAALLARRDASFASVQGHYYDQPPRIERGWRHHLASDQGRAYLDIVNNVSAIGHAHPAVERAVARQLRRLNTNSRFHYGAVVEFTERLTALLPEPLDTVFLVNSGSEAVDLGIRLAIGATGQEDVVALREAYHGWTYASDAVSTSLQDNPNALETRPRWVHTVDSPNSYRGRHRGADAVRYAPEAVAAIDELAAAGRAPGAFLGETWYGNAGGVALPDGYLEQVYAAVRRHGGLAVADEVQVGYGRLGHWFWGFEQQGVVPDIVCVAKAMGNGHPLGAVITSREVAERYRDQGYFFSSTGGSPVSCVVGSTVLDVLRDEDLQGNAVRVGARLKAGLEALGDRHPLVGAVHGSGLYLGLELVRDRTTLEPATEETAALCDRMLDLGVVVQPTGDHLNVLKIKPPLCIDAEAVDFFTAMLDRALGELGW